MSDCCCRRSRCRSCSGDGVSAAGTSTFTKVAETDRETEEEKKKQKCFDDDDFLATASARDSAGESALRTFGPQTETLEVL